MEKFILLTGHDGNKVVINADYVLAVCTERKGNTIYSCIVLDKKENSMLSPSTILVKEDVPSIYQKLNYKEHT